jgi:hypothetical protein
MLELAPPAMPASHRIGSFELAFGAGTRKTSGSA